MTKTAILIALVLCLSGCGTISFAPTNPGPSSYRNDPALQAAADAWQAKQK